MVIRRSAVKNPNLSSLQIKIDTGVKASSRTVRRRLLTQFGLRAYRPAKKPHLNKLQRDKRIRFCKKYLHWNEDDWSKILFSDESMFCQFGTETSFVRRPPKTRYLRRYTVPTMKHPPKVMVWACFSSAGRGSLYFIEQGKTVNADEYIKILKSKMKLSMQIHRCSTFQQDSAPCHTSKKVKDWMIENGVQVLEWPGNSPDLNPIENLWMVLKRKVRLCRPSNVQDLIYHIKRSWCLDITPELCQKLVQSMPKRLKSVIESKGFATKY